MRKLAYLIAVIPALCFGAVQVTKTYCDNNAAKAVTNAVAQIETVLPQMVEPAVTNYMKTAGIPTYVTNTVETVISNKIERTTEYRVIDNVISNYYKNFYYTNNYITAYSTNLYTTVYTDNVISNYYHYYTNYSHTVSNQYYNYWHTNNLTYNYIYNYWHTNNINTISNFYNYITETNVIYRISSYSYVNDASSSSTKNFVITNGYCGFLSLTNCSVLNVTYSFPDGTNINNMGTSFLHVYNTAGEWRMNVSADDSIKKLYGLDSQVYSFDSITGGDSIFTFIRSAPDKLIITTNHLTEFE